MSNPLAIPSDETRDPQSREAALMAALAAQIAHAQAATPHFATRLAGIDSARITSRAALAQLPLTRKSELIAAQAANPPFAGMALRPGLIRVFQSPGPIYDPEGGGPDWWNSARALRAAGFGAGDLIHNCFSYHLTPAGVMFETGAHAIGAMVFPGGTGNSEAQARAIADLRPAGYVGTPSFLKIILDKAAELELDSSSLTRALVTGEALPGPLRAELAARGVAVLQCYGTADLGVVGYESAPDSGLIVNEGVIVEIVRPGTGIAVPAGEVGEVVVTLLKPDYPLIRFATGDLSAELPGPAPCGRTNMRLKGWLGRADQTTKVKGMFVHPEQIAQVVARHPGLGRARLVVDSDTGADRMTLQVECADADAGLADAVAATVQAICKLKALVTLQPPGSLANDGKVIDDTRKIS